MRTSTSLRVLLFGKDGRTDAIASAIRKSMTTCILAVYSEFSIRGLIEKADEFRIGKLTDVTAMLAFAREFKPDLVIVGPEEPLEAGLVDALSTALRVPCFGPPQRLAKIETNKSWAREVVDTYQIPGNPEYRRFLSTDGLKSYVHDLGNVVVKPEGLTGGKGVRVMGDDLSADMAISYAREIIETTGAVIIEERLEGEEFSLQTITDGECFIHCPLVQDHKRAYSEDKGPNTGGMGSYSMPDGLLPFLETPDVERAKATNEAVIRALHSKTGQPYKGVLYGGFMAVRNGIRLIEYNARFGDPEAMNVLPVLATDFLELCWAVATGSLSSVKAQFEDKATVCKYVVPKFYPEEHSGDDIITVDESMLLEPGIECFWAATNLGEDGKVRLTGSRGLAFVGIGKTLAEAERLAERGASSVGGMVRHREDIGSSRLVEQRVQHMKYLRSHHSNQAP